MSTDTWSARVVPSLLLAVCLAGAVLAWRAGARGSALAVSGSAALLVGSLLAEHSPARRRLLHLLALGCVIGAVVVLRRAG